MLIFLIIDSSDGKTINIRDLKQSQQKFKINSYFIIISRPIMGWVVTLEEYIIHM